LGTDLFPFIFKYIFIHLHQESPSKLRLRIGNLSTPIGWRTIG
jgi:hypothetical protein